MGWCDEVLGLDPLVPPDRAQWEAAQARIADLPPDDLVHAWREVAHSSFVDRSPGADLFHTFFDGLGHDDPEKAVAFLEEAARVEEDDEVLALIGEDKLLLQLLHFNAGRIIDALEAACARTPRLRWLLGSVSWAFEGGAIEDETLRRRLAALADTKAYRAWREALTARADSIGFSALDVAALADAWIRINSWSQLLRARDDIASDLFDFQQDLVEDDPERALALISEIARRTDDARLIGLLGAGLLEDLLPAEEGPLIEAIEREAEANETFRIALCGAYLSGVGPAVAARINRACGRKADFGL